MITLLHGDNTASSREELVRRIEEAKTQGKEVRRLDGKALDALTLTQALESRSLFGDEVLVVIEKFLSKGAKLPVADTDVIIWEDKEIGKTLIAPLGANIEVKLFKIPVVIWQLLDSIKPRNASLLPLLHQALARDAAELVFYHVASRVRSLIMIKDAVAPEKIKPWQSVRLTSQARLFTMDKLLTMEKALLEIDVSIKSGTSPFSLAQQLELLFIDI